MSRNAAELHRYLRVGHNLQHGIAAGLMGAVVKELAALPDAEIAELANYMRNRYAPSEAAWRNVPADIARFRKASSN